MTEKDLTRWKLIADFQERLACARQGMPVAPTQKDPRRLLSESDYLSLLLFGLFNPVVESMRGLCAASELRRVREDVCSHRVSLGSFSEAQSVVEPELLGKVFEQLSSESVGRAWGDQRLTPCRKVLMAVDSTVWHALPRMMWALWRYQHGRECAVRLREDAGVRVLQELPLSAEDRAAGVISDAIVELGTRNRDRSVPLRLVRILGEEGQVLLVTDKEPAELSAELIGLIYRRRWQIALFFKWIKCILGCRHWLAESPRGVALQVYLALIAALLLQNRTGRRPGKRAMEMIRFYLLGYADLDELCHALKLKKNQA